MHLKLLKKSNSKTVKTTGYVIGNKIADRITKVSKTSPQNISQRNEEELEILREIYIYIQQELKKEDPEKFKKKYNQLEDKHAKFRRQLEKRRDKKWYKFKTRTNNGVQNETELIERLTKNNNRIEVSSSESVNESNVKETESNTLTSSSPMEMIGI